MTAVALSGDLSVLVVAAFACVAPAASRPTLQFGVRVPSEQAGAPVIQRERRAYFWRTMAVGAGCTVAAVTLSGHGSWWLSRIILLLELTADFGCFWVARRQITGPRLPRHRSPHRGQRRGDRRLPAPEDDRCSL